jgi:hypothetical protein
LYFSQSQHAKAYLKTAGRCPYPVDSAEPDRVLRQRDILLHRLAGSGRAPILVKIPHVADIGPGFSDFPQYSVRMIFK